MIVLLQRGATLCIWLWTLIHSYGGVIEAFPDYPAIIHMAFGGRHSLVPLRGWLSLPLQIFELLEVYQP
jgi:hypothetical protein